MKIKNLLEYEHSKRQMMKIVRFVGDDQEKFDELISFCFGDDQRMAQRASWPVRYCVEKHPELVRKHLGKMLKQLKKPGHNSIRRNFTYVMQFIDIPSSLETKAISVCFELLNSKSEFAAVKVFSMTVLAGFCQKYPDLIKELKSSIESQLPYEGAGFRNRGMKILRLFR